MYVQYAIYMHRWLHGCSVHYIQVGQLYMYICTVCYSYILYMYSRNCTYVMLLINPRWRVALRGVTVIGLSLCMCVCVSESNLVLQAIRGDL